MIKLTITGQTLSIVTQKVVSGTHDYLEVEGNFRTPDWFDVRKWVHFTKGEYNYVLPMHDDRISAEQHLDLTEGTWDVYVHGNYLEDDDVTERITTEVRYLYVEGPHDGKPFPPLTPELEEILANDVERALDLAQSVRDDADAGEFDGATYTPNVTEEGIISWTNDKGRENPEPQNIRGPIGPVGETTVHVGTDEPTDPRINVWINPNGMPGKVITGFAMISGSHQPGTYDTYRVSFNDSTYLDMMLYNGADGSGIGDMLKEVYDPQNKAQDIFQYTDDKVGAATYPVVYGTTTFSAISAAIGMGRTPVLKKDGMTLPLVSGSAAEMIFAAVSHDADGMNATCYVLNSSDVWSTAESGTKLIRETDVDSAMDDDSENPVQNKAVKAYVDERDMIFLVTRSVTTYAEIADAISDGKVPVLAIGNKFVLMRGLVDGKYAFSYMYKNDQGSYMAENITVNSSDFWSTENILVFTYNTIDTELSLSSLYPVSNQAITRGLNAKQDRLTIDTALSATSTNPVQNKEIYRAIQAAGTGAFATKTFTFAMTFPISDQLAHAEVDVAWTGYTAVAPLQFVNSPDNTSTHIHTNAFVINNVLNVRSFLKQGILSEPYTFTVTVLYVKN